METLKWFLIVCYVLSTIFNIVLIDQERTPYTKGGAVVSLIINVAMIWWILSVMK